MKEISFILASALLFLFSACAPCQRVETAQEDARLRAVATSGTGDFADQRASPHALLFLRIDPVERLLTQALESHLVGDVVRTTNLDSSADQERMRLRVETRLTVHRATFRSASDDMPQLELELADTLPWVLQGTRREADGSVSWTASIRIPLRWQHDDRDNLLLRLDMDALEVRDVAFHDEGMPAHLMEPARRLLLSQIQRALAETAPRLPTILSVPALALHNHRFKLSPRAMHAVDSVDDEAWWRIQLATRLYPEGRWSITTSPESADLAVQLHPDLASALLHATVFRDGPLSIRGHEDDEMSALMIEQIQLRNEYVHVSYRLWGHTDGQCRIVERSVTRRLDELLEEGDTSAENAGAAWRTGRPGESLTDTADRVVSRLTSLVMVAPWPTLGEGAYGAQAQPEIVWQDEEPLVVGSWRPRTP